MAVSLQLRDSAFNFIGQRVEPRGTIEEIEAAVIATPAKAIYVVD